MLPHLVRGKNYPISSIHPYLLCLPDRPSGCLWERVDREDEDDLEPEDEVWCALFFCVSSFSFCLVSG
jgi:hypothetical protein